MFVNVTTLLEHWPQTPPVSRRRTDSQCTSIRRFLIACVLWLAHDSYIPIQPMGSLFSWIRIVARYSTSEANTNRIFGMLWWFSHSLSRMWLHRSN